jgi:hypothetical protein
MFIMKKSFIYLLLLSFIEASTAGEFTPHSGTVEIRNESGQIETMAYAPTHATQTRHVDFRESQGQDPTFYKISLESSTGLSDPEPWGTWSMANDQDDSVVLTFPHPLPKSFILQLTHSAFGNNARELMPILIGDNFYSLRLQPQGVSSVMVNLSEGNWNTITMIPPFPQQPSIHDGRRLAVGLIQLNLIENVSLTSIANDDKKLSLNKGAEKQAKRFGAFLGKAGRDVRDAFK